MDYPSCYDTLKFDSFYLNSIIFFLSKLSNYVPNKIIYCSKFSYDIHKKLGYTKNKSIIIENGIDMIQFRPNKKLGSSFRKSQNIQQKHF